MRGLADYASGILQPSVRVGVTGLARSGKTVFTTALVRHLVEGTPLTAFRASAEGRIRRARLSPQPDDAVPRFPYEAHLKALEERRLWPGSTTQISELRVDIEYERPSGRWRGGASTLSVDIVDYPGEWLLDLALLDAGFAEWSRATVAASRAPERAALAAPWHARLAGLDPLGEPDEVAIGEASEAFKAYLAALRAGPEAVATTPPGRFLMPGDLAGSPALTFAPLDLKDGEEIRPGSLAALMERRFEAYKTHVVRPFFRDHFQRIDRQIVLVDVLAAVDAGPAALAELEAALDRVLMAFRAGRNTILSSLFSPRADRVLFAATKADHVHHTSHARLEALLRLLVNRAVKRTEAAGAKVGVVALASVRATRETTVRDGLQTLRTVAGTPEAGERVGDEIFDGETEAAIFPGDLPERAGAIFEGAVTPGSFRFPRFRPPRLVADAGGRRPALPHIRLDRAVEFLIGDRLQ
ncbi:YcjX family protein [Salinarimonas soli]|uniref:YcjX family protein n=1 Tax=Salinarimonas soli TaxID=1638099 RepID=UPI003F680412